MKSFFAVALCLSLVFTFASALIPHSYRQLQERDDETETPNRFLSWIKGIFKRQDSSQESSQNDVCYVDEYYTFVNGTDGNAFGKNVCQDLGIIYPNRTVTEDFTPTSTVTAVNTQIFTQDGLVRTTPVTIITVTVTPSGVQKRDAQVTPMAHDVRDLRNDYINLFRRQADNDTVLPEDDETIAASLSSACLCQTYIGTTITETYTNQPDYATLEGVVRTTTTVFSTRVDREITSTVTVTAPFETAAEPSESDSEDDESTAESSAAASATNSPQTSAASGGSMVVETTGVSQGTPSIEEPTSTETSVSPDPTAPPFTCPDDDGMVISQMLGSERFDYDVFCDKDLPTSPELSSVLDLTYDTFSECVASCSYANAQFDQPLCQGAAYFETASSSRNCILKSSANAMDSVSATGVNIAILKSIAIGFDDAHPEGTNTEVVSFSSETPTMDPEEMGSSIMSMMGSSASTMPMVTPPAVYSGRPVMNGVTAYSTYVSDGSTFSTGSVFSTYVSGNGSWYSAYYSTFSVAWTNVQTIFAAGETTYPVAYNNTGVTKESNGDGGYTLWKNITTSTASYQDNQTVFDVTEIIEADYIAPNGTQTSSSVTTNFYSYTQAAVGGANGGAANSDAGVVTSSYSTQTVIYSSGFAAGGTGLQASGIVQTPAPVITSTISTQSVIASSGGLNGGEGNSANGAAGSIVPTTITSTSVFSTQAVISSSGGLNGASSGEGSGAAGSTVPIIGGSSIVINTYGTAGSTGLVLSGVVSINGISGATSLVASGAVPSTGSITSTFIDTTVVSSIGGTQGALSTAASGAGSDSGTSGVTSTAASGEASPSTGTRTSSQALRTGIDSDSFSSAATYSGTSYLVPYPPIVTPPSGSVPAVNSSLPLPTGTGSAPFSQPSGPRVGTDSSSTPFGTGPVPYPPIETLPPTNETLSFPTSGLPASSSTPLGTGPVSYPGFSTSPPANATVPAPTGTPSGSFTNSRNPREGTDSSSTIPGTGLVPYPPLSTGPPSNVTTAVPTGTLPGSFTNTPNPREGTDSSSTLPGTGPVPYPPFTTGPPSKSTAPVPTGTSPSNMTLPAPSGSVFGSFSNSQTLRVGTDSESTTSRRRPFAAIQSLPPPVRATSTQASVSLSTGVVGNATESSSIPLSTGPPSNGTTPTLSFPTTSVPTSCPSQSIGTTTMWMTTTLLGCFSQCPPSGNGGYGGYGGGHDGYGNGPQSFGPPAAIFAPTLVGNPTPESTSPAETSSA